MTSAQVPIPPELDGKVVTPADRDRYSVLRSTYSAVHSPAYIVLARDEADVAAALHFAQDQGLAVAVRSGGHSLPGRSSNDGGVVIDLSSMNGIEILDPMTRLVRVQAGARWGEVATALDPHGMAISSGDHGNVGVGGLATSGGIGWMVREHGLTIDRIRSARIVLADGAVHEVSPDTDPDLFWAIRGGGSLMGVVTEFRFEATGAATVAIGQYDFDFGSGTGILAGWDEFVHTSPRALTATMMLFGGGGRVRASLTAVVASDDRDTALAALEPIATLGRPVGQNAQFAPYRTLVPASHFHHNVGQQKAITHNGMVDSVTSDVDAGVLDVLGSGATVQLRTLGGAIGDVSADATAFGNRQQSTLVIGVAWSPDDEALLDRSWKRLVPLFTGAYGNFESRPTAETIALAFPARTRQRLLALKARYDPAEVFATWPGGRAG